MTSEEAERLREGMLFIEKRKAELNSVLSEEREKHYSEFVRNQQRYLSYAIKIAEICFLIGSALISALVALDGAKNIQRPTFLFIGLLLYFLNGTYVFFGVKNRIEQQLSIYTPGAFRKNELLIYPHIFALDKLAFDQNNPSYISEYTQSKASFLVENVDIELPSERIDFFLDVAVALFFTASYLLSGSIWPYSYDLYWKVADVLLVIAYIQFFRNFKKARSQNNQWRRDTHSVNALKRSHLQWQKDVGIIK